MIEPLNSGPARVRRIVGPEPGLADPLAGLLADAVQGGASVGFLWPMAPGQAREWALSVLADLGPGLALWVAELDGRLVGSVQLGPCLKPNGRHRGELMKLLVLRSARRRGLASLLMDALERDARAGGLTLLVLDTLVGSQAEAVYRHRGWLHYGSVPGYAAHPDGALAATACFYKALD